jgi:hypothetical protein
LKLDISRAEISYLAAIAERVSHFATVWITPEVGGILITIPGFRVSSEISLAQRIASIFTLYLSESFARVSPATIVYLRICGDRFLSACSGVVMAIEPVAD